MMSKIGKTLERNFMSVEAKIKGICNEKNVLNMIIYDKSWNKQIRSYTFGSIFAWNRRY